MKRTTCKHCGAAARKPVDKTRATGDWTVVEDDGGLLVADREVASAFAFALVFRHDPKPRRFEAYCPRGHLVHLHVEGHMGGLQPHRFELRAL